MSKTISKEKESTSEKINRLAERTDKVLEKVSQLDESLEEYTEKELEYLDMYKGITGDAMDDEEIYDLIIQYNFDDAKIRREIDELMKLVTKKGEEYGWTKIEKGKKSKAEKKDPEVEVKHSDKAGKKFDKDRKSGSRYTNRRDENVGTEEVGDYHGQGQGQGQYYETRKYNRDGYNQEYNEGYIQEGYNNDYNQEGYNNSGYNNYRDYNNTYNNYRDYNYRGNRGRGYYPTRGRGRGRSQRGGYYQRNTNYDENALFQREINLSEVEVGVNKINEEVSQQENIQNIEQKEEVHTKEQPEMNPLHSHMMPQIESTHKQTSSEEDNNIFNAKDIPSNIRSNIKDLIEDETPIENVKAKEEQPQKRKFYDEFAVQSSSLSIGNANVNKKVNQMNTLNTVSSLSITPSTLNTPFQNTSFTQQGGKKTQTTSSGPVKQNIPTKKIENMQQPQQTQQPQQGDFQQPGYMPWPVGPMGFYMPPGVSGMNYDPNQMAQSNPMGYPMMPMYYVPNYGVPQGESDENMMKNKKMNNFMPFQAQGQSGPNDMSGMNPQQGQFPFATPYFYYNSPNPYMPMGMPQMGMNMGVNPNMEAQNFGYDMKNMKNSNEEPNQNFYPYNNFYKQG